MAFAYAPSNSDPPDLYVRWTWTKEMGVPWEKVGIADDDLGHLASLIGIKAQADGVKSKNRSKAAKAGHQKTI